MAGAVRNMMVRGGADFSKLDKALGKTSKNVKSMQTSFSTATKGIQTSVTKVGSVLNKVLAVAGVASFMALSKQAISTASDMEEVQNVVDTAFGKMSESAERFAKKAGLFNLSELQAKQTSSTYMAMAKSLGLAEEEASKMSIAAAALTGDMSSFFNVSQDAASTAVKSIWTGETETLKAYGVVMSQTALQQYALDKGIKKSYDTMTQAEKATLRYSFVMEKLSYVQGDAEKTADSWANKTKRVSERLKSILSIFGSGLINVLQGPLDFLDKLLDRLEYAAKLFQAITVKLYGDSGGSSGSAAMAAAMGEAAGSAEELENNITAAGEAAKKATLPMDQLHKLSGSDSSSGSSSSDDSLGLLSGAGDFYTNRLNADDVMGPDLTEEINARADKIVAAINKVKDKISEFKAKAFDKIGSKVDFEDVKEKISTLVDFVKEHKEEILSIIATIGIALAAVGIVSKVNNIVKTINLLGGPLKVVTTLMKGFGQSIGLVSGPMVAIAAVIAIVVAALWQLYHTNDEVKLAMDAAWEGLKETWSDTCAMFKTLWETILKPALEALWQIIQMIWDEVILPIMEQVAKMLPYIVARISEAIKTAIKIIEAIGPSVQKIFGGVATFISGIIDILSGILTGDWSKVCEGFKKIGSGAVDFITGIFEGAVSAIKAFIDAINPLNWGEKLSNKVNEWKAKITGEEVVKVDASRSNETGRLSGGMSLNLKKFASGGVVYGDSAIRVGEYAGANTNPEVIAPQSILRETMAESNMGVIDALYAMSSRVCKAIEENRAVVNVGGKTLADDITKQQNDKAKMTGKPILAV